MKLYLKNHSKYAGHWIYNFGYKAAWEANGFDVVLFDNLTDITDSDFFVMATDSDVTSKESIEVLSKAKKGWLYTQPTTYPGKFGKHPMYLTSCSSQTRKELSSLHNINFWTFLTEHEKSNLFSDWNKKVFSVPLAFDDVNYLSLIKPIKPKYQYDICFIGGRAINGFDDKIKLMEKTFEVFKNSGLNTGFFIDKNLSLADEANILYHSKVGLNIHDINQLSYGFDTNERTFKTLGLTGVMISDCVGQLEKFFPNIATSNEAEKLVEYIKSFLQLIESEQKKIKENNREMILKHHTYRNRVKDLLDQ